MATDAMLEPVRHRATAVVGDTHFEALDKASQRRFGRRNVSAFLRILIDEWYRRTVAKDGKRK
jgi:hypothetical protein